MDFIQSQIVGSSGMTMIYFYYTGQSGSSHTP